MITRTPTIQAGRIAMTAALAVCVLVGFNVESADAKPPRDKSPKYFCGDGKVNKNLGEICDGNEISCQTPEGYPGIQMCLETCDGYGSCASSLFCGDGICTETAENYFSCSADCDSICGNGVIEPGEACDDGNISNRDGCSSSCTVESIEVSVDTDRAEYDSGESVHLSGFASERQEFLYSAIKEYSRKNFNQSLTTKRFLKKITNRLSVMSQQASVIINKSNQPVSGFLMMKVLRVRDGQIFDAGMVVDEGVERKFRPGEELFLSDIWRDAGAYMTGHVGEHFVYVGLRDSDGNIIVQNEVPIQGIAPFHVFSRPFDVSLSMGNVMDIAEGPDGHMVAVGYRIGHTDFPQSEDTRIIKFDVHGNILWDKSIDFGNMDRINSVVVDSQNNIIITGFFQPVDNLVVNMAKLSPQGDVLWNQAFTTGGLEEEGTSLVLDESDRIFFVGKNGETHSGIVSFTPNGAPLWHQLFPSSTNEDIALDGNGYLYTFGTVPGTDGRDWRVHKMDVDGNLVWTMVYPRAGQDLSSAVAVTPDNGVILAGNVANGANSEFSVIRIDPADGSIVWEYSSNLNNGLNIARDLSIHADGYIFVSGEESGEMALKVLDPNTGAVLHESLYGPMSANGLDLVESNRMVVLGGQSDSATIRLLGTRMDPKFYTNLNMTEFTTSEIQAAVGVNPPPTPVDTPVLQSGAVVPDEVKEDAGYAASSFDRLKARKFKFRH